MDVRISGSPSEITEALARLRAGDMPGNRTGGGYPGKPDGDDGGATRLACIPKRLPQQQQLTAALRAIQINPVNRPALERIPAAAPAEGRAGAEARAESLAAQHKEFISVLTTKYWGPDGVRLTVGFLDNPSAELRARILSHLNAWSQSANVEFVEARTDPQVRIARTEGDGHWSYVGTDVLSIPRDEATMNLDSFTMNTPEGEYRRVVRHEAGHTLGFPHEHMRRELVERIDERKAIAYFRRNQGWNEREVRQQVLTPLEEDSILGTDRADQTSIMCYQLPAEITKDGEAILGGDDINDTDHEFAGIIYPVPEAVGQRGGHAPRSLERYLRGISRGRT